MWLPSGTCPSTGPVEADEGPLLGRQRRVVHVELLIELVYRKSTGGGDNPQALPVPCFNLAICKGIVEVHGGRNWAEREGQGRGSRFHFTLPATEAPCLPRAGRGAAHRRQFRILVVGRQTTRRRWAVLCDALEEAG